MSVRYKPSLPASPRVAADVDAFHSAPHARLYYADGNHSAAAWSATKEAAWHSGHALRSAGGRVWEGLTALASTAATAATNAAYAARGHVAALTNHVASAHNEVVRALDRASGGRGSAKILERHFKHHHETTGHVRKHIADVVREHGLLHAGASANHVVQAADLAAGGAPLDHVVNKTVRNETTLGAPMQGQHSIVSMVHDYIKSAASQQQRAHRAANVQAAATAAVLEATVAGAEQVDAGNA